MWDLTWEIEKSWRCNVDLVAAFSECDALNAPVSFWRHYVKLETENKCLNQKWSDCFWSHDLANWQPIQTHAHTCTFWETKLQCLEISSALELLHMDPYRHELALMHVHRSLGRSEYVLGSTFNGSFEQTSSISLWSGVTNHDVLCSMMAMMVKPCRSW